MRFGSQCGRRAEDAPRPEEPDRSARRWEPDELGRFLSSVNGTRLFPMWELFAVTGMRRGEGLRPSLVGGRLDAATVSIVRATVVVDHKAVESTPKTKRSTRCPVVGP